MDPGLPSLSVSALMVCLLGAARCSTGDELLCHSVDIPQFETQLTQEPRNMSYQIGGRYRYKCKEGYLRKAGTSDLLRCIEVDGKAEWSKRPELQCIRNPRWTTTTKPPTTPVTTVASTGSSQAQQTTPVVSVSAETHSAETTSISLHVPTNPTQAGGHDSAFPTVVTETSRTTSNTSASQGSNSEPSSDKKTMTVATTLVVLLLVLFLTGIALGIYCWRKRQRRKVPSSTKEESEEEMPMKPVPPEQEP